MQSGLGIGVLESDRTLAFGQLTLRNSDGGTAPSLGPGRCPASQALQGSNIRLEAESSWSCTSDSILFQNVCLRCGGASVPNQARTQCLCQYVTLPVNCQLGSCTSSSPWSTCSVGATDTSTVVGSPLVCKNIPDMTARVMQTSITFTQVCPCKPGYHQGLSSICTRCPTGRWSAGGLGSTCQVCPSGAEPSDKQDQCVCQLRPRWSEASPHDLPANCNPGHLISPSDPKSCAGKKTLAPGESCTLYGNEAGQAQVRGTPYTCIGVGAEVELVGRQSCPCPAGWYQASTGSGCQLCPVGKYSAGDSWKSCVNCPADSTPSANRAQCQLNAVAQTTFYQTGNVLTQANAQLLAGSSFDFTNPAYYSYIASTITFWSNEQLQSLDFNLKWPNATVSFPMFSGSEELKFYTNSQLARALALSSPSLVQQVRSRLYFEEHRGISSTGETLSWLQRHAVTSMVESWITIRAAARDFVRTTFHVFLADLITGRLAVADTVFTIMDQAKLLAWQRKVTDALQELSTRSTAEKVLGIFSFVLGVFGSVAGLGSSTAGLGAALSIAGSAISLINDEVVSAPTPIDVGTSSQTADWIVSGIHLQNLDDAIRNSPMTQASITDALLQIRRSMISALPKLETAVIKDYARARRLADLQSVEFTSMLEKDRIMWRRFLILNVVAANWQISVEQEDVTADGWAFNQKFGAVTISVPYLKMVQQELNKQSGQLGWFDPSLDGFKDYWDSAASVANYIFTVKSQDNNTTNPKHSKIFEPIPFDCNFIYWKDDQDFNQGSLPGIRFNKSELSQKARTAIKLRFASAMKLFSPGQTALSQEMLSQMMFDDLVPADQAASILTQLSSSVMGQASIGGSQRSSLNRRRALLQETTAVGNGTIHSDVLTAFSQTLLVRLSAALSIPTSEMAITASNDPAAAAVGKFQPTAVQLLFPYSTDTIPDVGAALQQLVSDHSSTLYDPTSEFQFDSSRQAHFVVGIPGHTDATHAI